MQVVFLVSFWGVFCLFVWLVVFYLDIPKLDLLWNLIVTHWLLTSVVYCRQAQYLWLSSVFISKVCRVAYEIMQTLHPDASAYFHSLDDIYYFGGQNAHNQIAVYAHHPRTADEIPMEPGDIIGVAGNHWDGYSKGINRKLGRTGLYPSYKVKEKIETVKYPTYPEADK